MRKIGLSRGKIGQETLRKVRKYADNHWKVTVLLPGPSILARTQEVYMLEIYVAE